MYMYIHVRVLVPVHVHWNLSTADTTSLVQNIKGPFLEEFSYVSIHCISGRRGNHYSTCDGNMMPLFFFSSGLLQRL